MQMLSKLKPNKEIFSKLTPVFMGIFAAVIVFFILHLTYFPKQIATVDVSHMIDQFVKTQSTSNASAEILQANVTQFGQSLNKILQVVSKEKRLVLLPKEAVITGAMDVSQEIEKRLNSEMNRKSKGQK